MTKLLCNFVFIVSLDLSPFLFHSNAIFVPQRCLLSLPKLNKKCTHLLDSTLFCFYDRGNEATAAAAVATATSYSIFFLTFLLSPLSSRSTLSLTLTHSLPRSLSELHTEREAPTKKCVNF